MERVLPGDAVAAGQTLAIEVKGHQDEEPRCFLTPLGRNMAAEHKRKDWRLLMVTNSLPETPQITVRILAQFASKFVVEPITYRAVLKDRRVGAVPA